MSNWTPASWRSEEFTADQQPTYGDLDALQDVVKRLQGLPPLIFAGEARLLMDELACASRGEAFVLQAGDCAETFADFSANRIRDLLKVILQVAVVLTYSSGVPVVKIGRVAGQFAKPRSSPFEDTPNGRIDSYKGDIVNRVHPSTEARVPDPENMIRAYEQAAQTLNLVRGFTDGGFADLNAVHSWNREFVASSPEGQRYEGIASGIDAALRFMKACHIESADIHRTRLYSSHEALLLEYEHALARQDSTLDDGPWYGCSGHMLWIGTRTKALNSAHVEFLSGVRNPIGLKIGPDIEPDDLLRLCERLDPNRQPGRLTLISRMGKTRLRNYLPKFIETVTRANFPVVWMCDPMHGNTIVSEGGLKTRRFDDLLDELSQYFAVHKELGTWPGGVHLELTGDNVTECLGGSDELTDAELHQQYLTACDPRLNARQSLDLAFNIAEMLQTYA